MKILLIGPARINNPDGDALIDGYKQIIDDGIQGADIDVTVHTTVVDEILIDVTTDDLIIYDARNQCEISEYDVLIMRGHGIGRFVDVMGAMTLYAKKHGIKMVNEYSVTRDPSKLLQNVHFHFNGMRIPRTLYINRGLIENQDWAQWTFPGVMKLVNGSLGLNNYIVHNWDEVREIYGRDLKKRYILQEFIPNDGDLRLLLIGEGAFMFKRVSTDGSHLNNTSHGGSAETVDVSELPEKVLNQSRQIAKQYGMSISGVDVMQDRTTGEYYFLEVNMQPQISTGALLKEKQALLVEYIKSLVS